MKPKHPTPTNSDLPKLRLRLATSTPTTGTKTTRPETFVDGRIAPRPKSRFATRTGIGHKIPTEFQARYARRWCNVYLDNRDGKHVYYIGENVYTGTLVLAIYGKGITTYSRYPARYTSPNDTLRTNPRKPITDQDTQALIDDLDTLNPTTTPTNTLT